MKRIFLLLLVLVLTVSLFMTGCGNSEAEREEELKNTLETTSEKLQSNFSGTDGDYSLVSEYLKSWANSNELKLYAYVQKATLIVKMQTDALFFQETER